MASHNQKNPPRSKLEGESRIKFTEKIVTGKLSIKNYLL